MDGDFRIEQLSRLVALALGVADYDGQASGRVRDVPDVRTIRYYTTLGLVDRPSEMRGRTAYYGRRHLLQLVAIKRLQAGGMSLDGVQQRLVGVGEKRLTKLADLPTDFWERAEKLPPATKDHNSTEAPPKAAASRANFWQAAPQLRTAAVVSETPAPAVVLPVSANVRLLIEGIETRKLTSEFFESIAPALAALRDAVAKTMNHTTEVHDHAEHEPASSGQEPSGKLIEENEHDDDRSQAE